MVFFAFGRQEKAFMFTTAPIVIACRIDIVFSQPLVILVVFLRKRLGVGVGVFEAVMT